MDRPEAILIAGPTASGKSGFALDLAERFDGEIINADSMQIYPVLNVLTARPPNADLERVPHHLYGYAPLEKPCSVADWLPLAKTAADAIWKRGRIPIFVGGTGLYFKALEEGLAATPEIPAAIRQGIRDDLIREGSEVLHARLQMADPEAAAHLKPGDSHRISRALEVVTATGQSLLEFQKMQQKPGFLASRVCRQIVLMPPRPVLHERINARTGVMLEGGAMDEVRTLLALDLPLEATVLKAIGVKQLGAVLRREISLDEAKTRIQAATRQYAKRQCTWFNGQFGNNWITIESTNGAISAAKV